MRSAIPALGLPGLLGLISCVAAACGGSTSHPDAAPATVDAPAPAPDSRVDAAVPAPDADLGLACLGDPAPTGTGTVTLAGRVFDVVAYDAQPFAGATVELHARAGGALLDSVVSDADGTFSFTTTAPVDDYVVVTAPGKVPTYAYADDLAAEQDDLLFVVDAAELTQWYADAGHTYTDGARTIVALIRDCVLDAATGATVAASPSAAVTYYSEADKRWDPTLATGDNGFALITDAPASLALTPHFAGADFPPETISSLSSTVTLVVISPFN